MLPEDCAGRWPVITSSTLARRYSELSADELFRLCADRGNDQAWEEFLSRFNTVIVSTAKRIARHYTQPTKDLCDDLAHRVYLKLIDHDRRILREFVPKHQDASFGYLKVITENVVRDYFRGIPRRETEPLPDDPPFDDRDQIHKKIVIRQMDDFLKRNVSERDRTIFWLNRRQGMTAKAIAAIPAINLTTHGVEAVIKRVTDLLRDEFGGWPKGKA